MLRWLLTLALAVALAVVAALPAAAAVPRTTGRYLVVFKHPATARSAKAVSGVLARAGVRRAGRGARRLGVATVRGSAGALRTLRRDPVVASVTPEYLRQLRRI